MKPDTRARAVLFVTAFLTLAAGAFWGLPSGKAVVGALTILDGGVPYRDFWTMYAPGQFYAVAALFSLFGRELLVQAIAVAIIRAASAVVFFGLLQASGATRRLAMCLAIVFVLMFWTTGPELTDYPPALFFLLLAVVRLVRYFGGGGVGDLRWGGVWIGCAACFKHDVAAYVAFGAAMSLALSWVLLRNRRPAGWLSPVHATVTVAVSALLACAPLALWTAWSAGADAWNDLVVFPATVFSKVRGDQFPPVIPDWAPVATWLSDLTNVVRADAAAESLSTWVILYAPPVVFVSALAVVIVKRERLEAAALANILLLLAPMPFLWSAAHVQQNTHPYSLAILGAGAAVTMWSQSSPSTRRMLWRPLAVAVPLYAGALVIDAVRDAALVFYERSGSRVLELSGMQGIRVPARLYESFRPVGRFFRDHTREGEPVYTGLRRHDSIVINNTLLYAIVGRPACCGYTELHPGVADRTPVQREIVRMLEMRRVRAIALWDFGWSPAVMAARKAHTTASIPDAGSTVLDRYIADNFLEVERHGEYHILWRRDAPATFMSRQYGEVPRLPGGESE